MKEVKRWAGGDEQEHPLYEIPDGNWVDIDDYVRLCGRLAALERVAAAAREYLAVFNEGGGTVDPRCCEECKYAFALQSALASFDALGVGDE